MFIQIFMIYTNLEFAKNTFISERSSSIILHCTFNTKSLIQKIRRKKNMKSHVSFWVTVYFIPLIDGWNGLFLLTVDQQKIFWHQELYVTTLLLNPLSSQFLWQSIPLWNEVCLKRTSVPIQQRCTSQISLHTLVTKMVWTFLFLVCRLDGIILFPCLNFRVQIRVPQKTEFVVVWL